MIREANWYALEPIEADLKVSEDKSMSVSATNFPFKEKALFGKGANGSVWKVDGEEDGKAYSTKLVLPVDQASLPAGRALERAAARRTAQVRGQRGG